MLAAPSVFLRKCRTCARLAFQALAKLYSRVLTVFFRACLPSFSALFYHHTGKMSDKWALYLKTYDTLLAPWRRKPLSLLEIGVQNGGSLELWGKYFRKAKIILGCDIDPKCANLRFQDPRIQVVVGDANTPKIQERLYKAAPNIDLIIDDGSHKSLDIITTFLLYFPLLKTPGLYIIEDLPCSYWASHGGGCFTQHLLCSSFKN